MDNMDNNELLKSLSDEVATTTAVSQVCTIYLQAKVSLSPEGYLNFCERVDTFVKILKF